jgi:hypothetical protein
VARFEVVMPVRYSITSSAKREERFQAALEH